MVTNPNNKPASYHSQALFYFIFCALTILVCISIISQNFILMIAVFSAIGILHAFFIDWKLFVLMNVIILPTFQKLPFLEIGPMDLNKFLLVGLIGSYIFVYKLKLKKLQKEHAFIFKFFIFWYLCYTQYYFLKGTLFNFPNAKSDLAIQLIVWVVTALALYLSLSKINHAEIQKAVEFGLIGGTILLVVSAIFYENLAALGLTTRVLHEGKNSFVIRTSGLYNGHPTQFSALLAIMFGYFLARMAQTTSFHLKTIYLGLLALIISGFLINPSRNGLVGVVVILIVFLAKNRFSKNIVFFILMTIIGLVLIVKFGDALLYRMSSQKFSQQLHESRLALLSHYIQELRDNPYYFLYGTLKPYHLNTHNTYLEIIYRGGIGFFALFSYFIIKLYLIRKKAAFDITYPMLGYLVPMFGNNNPVEFYLIFILALAFAKPGNAFNEPQTNRLSHNRLASARGPRKSNGPVSQFSE